MNNKTDNELIDYFLELKQDIKEEVDHDCFYTAKAYIELALEVKHELKERGVKVC